MPQQITHIDLKLCNGSPNPPHGGNQAKVQQQYNGSPSPHEEWEFCSKLRKKNPKIQQTMGVKGKLSRFNAKLRAKALLQVKKKVALITYW